MNDGGSGGSSTRLWRARSAPPEVRTATAVRNHPRSASGRLRAAAALVAALLVATAAAGGARAGDPDAPEAEPPSGMPPEPAEAPVIELYTMGPGALVFEKFGHAALCVHYRSGRPRLTH